MRELIPAGICLMMFVAFAARLRAQRLVSEPVDVHVLVGTDSTSADTALSGTLRLKAVGADVSTLTIAGVDLRSQDTLHVVIPPEHVTLVGPIALTKDKVTDVTFKLLVRKRSATYVGSLVLAAGKSRDTVPLTVRVRTRASLVPQHGSDTIRAAVVLCMRHNWFSCGIAHSLFSPAAFDTTRTLTFDNPGLDSVRIISAAFIGGGDSSRVALSRALHTAPATMLPGLSGLRLGMIPDSLTPDRYSGALLLALADGSRVSIPIAMTVRAGPGWALLAIIFGYLLGRLAKYMQDAGTAQATALAAVYRLQADVQRCDPEDQKLLRDMVEDVRREVYERQLTTVTADIAAIRARAKLLTEVRDIETTLLKRTPHPQDLLDLIDTIRTEVLARDDAKAQATFQQLVQQIGSPPRSVALLRAVQSSTTSASPEHPGVARTRAVGKWLGQFLFTATDAFRAEATLWFLEPVLYIGLFLLTVVVGLNTLYVQHGATLGAEPLPDYLALVLWGLSADVAGRTLATLGTLNK